MLGLDQDNGTVKHRPRGAHPGTQHGAVSRGLMMGMMPGMFDGCRLSQPADGQNAKHEEDGEDFQDTTIHWKTPTLVTLRDNFSRHPRSLSR